MRSIHRAHALLQDKTEDGKMGTDAPSDATEVTATFTANVWEVLVRSGDQVQEGQKLVVLEAMKMEYPLMAPHDGRVCEVLPSSSDLAQQGDLLLTLEKAATSTVQRVEE